MLVYESLSAADLEAIKTYIEFYAGADGNETTLTAPIEHILRFWSANKEDLFRLFGGKTILSREILISKSTYELEEEISKMISLGGDGIEFYHNFCSWYHNLPCDIRWDAGSLIYTNYLATNIYTGKSFNIPIDDKHSIAVNAGCKISKVLGKIAKEFKLDGYEAFRIAHSQCLNQKALKGTLCLSIHPLDYMTMSDNDCGWESCMSWQQPGDYRIGTVEMMNSPCVVVAYLKSSEDMSIVDDITWTWNSKKWRQLFIVTPELISGIRQYPYDNDEISGVCLKWLRELAETNASWGPYAKNAVQIHNNRDNTFAEINKESYISISTRYMYNDYGCNQTGYISIDFPKNYGLCTSGETECMKCGEDISDYGMDEIDTALLCCNECEHVFRCGECGERISIDDMVMTSSGYRVCSYCYEEYFKECALCGEVLHESDTIQLYLALSEDDITSYRITVCDNGVDSDKFKKLFGEKISIKESWWNTKEVVLIDNMTLEGLNYFDVWHAEDYERFKAQIEARTKNET